MPCERLVMRAVLRGRLRAACASCHSSGETIGGVLIGEPFFYLSGHIAAIFAFAAAFALASLPAIWLMRCT